MPKADAAPKLEAELTLTKTTPGTFVLGNEDLGLKGFYFPKVLLTTAGIKPVEGKKYKLTLTEA